MIARHARFHPGTLHRAHRASPAPPRWAFGYQHSRWGFKTLAEARRVVQGFRERNLPLGVLHLDIDHMRGFRTLTTDETAFPDLKSLSDELHARRHEARCNRGSRHQNGSRLSPLRGGKERGNVLRSS